MARTEGKIALGKARSTLDRVRGTDPPHVSIDKARELLGPDIFRMIGEGWLDDDLISLFSDQNESDLRTLLIEARREERRARKQRQQRNGTRTKSHPRPVRAALPQTIVSPPMLTTDRSTQPALALPRPAASDPGSQTISALSPISSPTTNQSSGGPRRNTGID